MWDHGIDTEQFALEYLADLKSVVESLPLADVEAIIASLTEAYKQGRQIFIIGNGGSAATASHMACDLGKTVLGKGIEASTKRFRVIALTDNMPLITAWANDTSYETVFAEQLRNLANRGDWLVVITGSGTSPNIVEAIKVARRLGLKSIGFLGFDGGIVKELLDQCVIVESDNYGHIEDIHMILTHLVTAYFKQALENGGISSKKAPLSRVRQGALRG